MVPIFRFAAFSLGLCICAAMPSLAVAAAPPLTAEDVFALEWAAQPQLSPDGKQIIYQRSGFDRMTDRKRSALWQINVASGEQRPLGGEGNQSGAAWSPDGERLAYVGSGKNGAQIYVRWLDDGVTARITQLERGAGSLTWSPDGRSIAFTQRVQATSKPLATDMPKPPKDAKWADPVKVIDAFTYRFDGAGYIEPGYSHVFIVDANGGAARQITTGEHDFNGPLSFTADGSSLILSANPVDDADYDPIESDIYRVAIEDGALTRLTQRDGPDSNPVLSPDGKRVAYLGFNDQRLGYHNAVLSVLDLASGESTELTADLDRSVDDMQWDGNRGLFIQYDDHGDTRIGWVSVRGGRIENIADSVGGTAMGRPYGGGSMQAAAGSVVYTSGSEYRPADISLATRNSKPRQLTRLNRNLLDARTLGKVEELTWKSSFDQREVQGWLVYPPDFDASKTYPLLLEIHGGPFANYGPRFAPEIQLYAARGYLVLYTNPRGSTSYGAEFANLIHHNYPGQDYDDLISGVDAVIERGNVDSDNLFVTGGSGGGVLTAWIVGHTDRFRAAVVAKPVINWYSFVLTSDAYGFFSSYWFPGKPWDHVEHYMKRSPISYVQNVTTPTMLISGESDHRTPISEAEQYYQALKLQKVDTALVRIPGASHSINARPSQMIAQVLNSAAWFERYRKQQGDSKTSSDAANQSEPASQ
jgi:acylaminoacyl-peptidase